MAADSGQTPSQLIVCRTSGLAVIAFALSLLSISISAGVAAIVLGVLALRRINRSSQMLTGRGLAEAAIVLPILIGVPLFLLAWKGNTHIAPSELSCGANLSSIGKAMLLYAYDHDEQFPTPSRWCDLLVSTQQVELREFRCHGPDRAYLQWFYPLELSLYLWHRSTSGRRGPSDYAMNEHATSISAAHDLVLCFEVESGWNQVGGPQMLTTDRHEGRGCNVLFLDTRVEFVKTKDLGRLKWKPTP